MGERKEFSNTGKFLLKYSLFSLVMFYEKGELAMLLLEEEDGGVHRYYINTSAAKNFEAMCVGTFLKNDPRNVDVYVNKCGLSKNVRVRVLLEDKIYETGVEIRME